MKRQLLIVLYIVFTLNITIARAQEYTDNSSYYYNNFETATAGTISSLGSATNASATRAGAGISIDASTISPLEGSVSLASTNVNAVGAIRWDFLGNGTTGIDLNANDYEWNFIYKNTTTLPNDDPDQIAAGNNSWRYWLAANGYATNDMQGFYISHVGTNLVLRFRYDAATGSGRYNPIISTPLPNDQNAYMIKVQRMRGGTWAIYINKYVTGMTTAKTLVAIDNTTPGVSFPLFTTYNYSYLQATSTTARRFQWDKFDMYTRMLKFVGTNANSAANGITQPPYSENQTVILYGLQVQSRGNFAVGNQFYVASSGSVGLNDYFNSNTGGMYKSYDSYYSTTADQPLSNSVQLSGSGSAAIYVASMLDTIATSGELDGTLSTPQYYFFTGTTKSQLNYGNPPTGTFTLTGVTTFYEKPNNSATGVGFTSTGSTSTTISFARGFDWKGGTGGGGIYPWSTASNWVQGSVPGSADIARFGIGTNTFTTQPFVTANTNIGTVIIGPNTINGINTPTTLTLYNFTLTAANGITVNSTGNITLTGISPISRATLSLGSTSTSIINPTGTLAATNTNITTTGSLYLLSDATGTGSVGALVGSTLTTPAAKTFVQRYVSAVRGYRLFSSPVTSGSGYFSLAYLKSTAWLTGTTGINGGFDKTGSPTIYFFRENMAPSNTSFTGGNFRGINSFPTPPYSFDGESSSYNIPVGNGFLFFFRGDKSLASIATATTSSTIPTKVVFTASGNLNTGPITVTPWYTPGTAIMGYTTATANNAIRGYNLVGNPYPSTINWEKYNRNGTNSSIYGSGSLASTIYVYNTNSKQYASYQLNTNAITAVTDTTSTIKPGNAVSSDGVASNMIASGQGFFIIATNPTSQSLTFRETAKTSTAPATISAAKIMSLPTKKLMGAPVATNNLPDPVFRIKLFKDDLNTDAVTFVLNNHNDTKFSYEEDALDIGGNGAQVSLSALSSDKVLLSINRSPLPKLAPQVFPVTVDAAASGLYSLKMDALENMPALYQVFLKDALKGDSLDMRTYNTYNFNIDKGDANTFGNKRFTLVIRQNPALALKLLHFNATKVTQGAKLTWITENEANYTNFTVERSTDDGKTFEIVGGLHGGGNGTYALVDAKPVKGLNQYRLKQDDINGTITYSKVVNLMYADVNGIAVKVINIYPNPVSNTVNVSIINPGITATTYAISITNGSGLLVKKTASAPAAWQANVADLLPGTYFVQVTNNTTKAIIGNGKFIKL